LKHVALEDNNFVLNGVICMNVEMIRHNGMESIKYRLLYSYVDVSVSPMRLLRFTHQFEIWYNRRKLQSEICLGVQLISAFTFSVILNREKTAVF